MIWFDLKCLKKSKSIFCAPATAGDANSVSSAATVKISDVKRCKWCLLKSVFDLLWSSRNVFVALQNFDRLPVSMEGRRDDWVLLFGWTIPLKANKPFKLKNQTNDTDTVCFGVCVCVSSLMAVI